MTTPRVRVAPIHPSLPVLRQDYATWPAETTHLLLYRGPEGQLVAEPCDSADNMAAKARYLRQRGYPVQVVKVSLDPLN